MNKQLLMSHIVKNDRNQQTLAKAMGISLSNLNAKINNNKTDFRQNEISFIKERYNLSEEEMNEIFFA
jgi:hypothetical protein